MHEMGIAMRIVDIAKSAIPPEAKDRTVTAVTLRVGKLSAIVPESMRFCFTVVSRDTPLEGARLDIEEIPVTAVCEDCHDDFTITGADFTCPKCKGPNLKILTGRELTVASIELSE